MKKLEEGLFSLKGKVALVTGAGQNIGAGIATALAYQGARVAIIDKDIKKAQAISNSLCRQHYDVMAIRADVTKPDDINSMTKQIIERWGHLNIAFNNVGLCYGGEAEDMTPGDWQKIIRTNLDATFYCCQQVFHLMRDQGGGKIINTASVAGVLVPNPQKISAYNTAKAAIIHLTRSLSAEWASYNIQVNCISPGTLNVEAFEKEEMLPWVNAWKSQIPAGRLANVDDLIGAAILLASPGSDYITGQNIIIDGGHTLW